mgnify:CR=1 FL=1
MDQLQANQQLIEEDINEIVEKTLDMEAGSKEKSQELSNAIRLYELRQKDRAMDLEEKRLELDKEKLKSQGKITWQDILKYSVMTGLTLFEIFTQLGIIRETMVFEDEHYSPNMLRYAMNKNLVKKKNPV